MTASILVVEDEPAIQELVSFTCSSNGYRVRHAESVGAAQEAIREELPDLVILDWMLPDRSGIDLLRALVPYREGDFALAATDFASMIARHPQSAAAHFYLGMSELMRGDQARAVAALSPSGMFR